MSTSPNKNINAAFKKAASQKRAALVAYVTAGDPDFDTSIKVIDNLLRAGIDILELGVPFSDPLADGEANQLAAVRALNSGMTSMKVLDLAAEIRKKYSELPIVLFTYMNPVAYAGDYHAFCSKAASSGVDAILPLDMPPEEAKDYRQGLDDAGLNIVSLVAPTSDEKRIKILAKYASAFIYYVCREGVTGERKDFAEGVDARVALIKKHTKLPVVVGFGIGTPEHIRAAAGSGVDGVVVGSAIVRKVEALSKGTGTLDDIYSFVKGLRDAL